MTVILNGDSLTIDKLTSVARNNKKVKVSDNSWKKIDACRKKLISELS